MQVLPETRVAGSTHRPGSTDPLPSPDAMVELASGVDALYLSGRGELDVGFLTKLDEAKQRAVDKGGAVPCEVGPLVCAMRPHGWGRYRYCIEHPTGRLGFTDSRRLPAVRIQPRSIFLHAVGPPAAADTFRHLVEPFCSDLSVGVSRIDLCVDVEGWAIAAEDRERFVCRADARRTYEEKGRCTLSMPRFMTTILAKHLLRRGRPGPDELVFVAPDGGPLHAGNFRNRVLDTGRQARRARGLHLPRAPALGGHPAHLARSAGPSPAAAPGALLEPGHP